MTERDLLVLDVCPEGSDGERIPAAVAEATFTLFGVTLRCYVLDNGQRVIHEDDIVAFFEALANGDGSEPSNDGLDKLARWLKGLD